LKTVAQLRDMDADALLRQMQRNLDAFLYE